MRHLVGTFAAAALVAGVFWACGGTSPTEPTSPASCSFSLSGSSLSFGAGGGAASITVTTTAACAWTAASDRGWMTLGGAGASGSASITVTASANGAVDARSGTLTIAGQTVPVRQDGAQPCTVTLSPSSASFPKDAATATFTVSAPAGCAWSAASSVEWVTVTSGASGAGNGTVGYSVARNASTAARTGAIRAGDVTFSIAQSADAGLCAFSVAPVSLNACMSSPSELVAAVTTQASCAWTATTDTPWIAVSGGESRLGPGEVRFRIGDNFDAPRLGVLKIRWDTPTAGQNVQVAQAGCRYAVSTGTIAVPIGGGTFSFDVFQESDPLECGGPLQNGCLWMAAPAAPWIAILTSMPQAGDGRVTFSVAANAGTARATTITVRDKVVAVLQAAR